jgi:hypothetical protein
MKKFWSIPILTAFIYSSTVLFNGGYISYFGVPGIFVSGALKENIVYSYIWVNTLVANFWGWLWILLIVFISGLIILFFWWRAYVVFLGIATLTMVVFVYKSASLGELTAKAETSFFTPASRDCLNIDGNTRFIIPYFNNDEALLIPLENDTNKIKGGFTTRKISDIPCTLILRNIGKIEK